MSSIHFSNFQLKEDTEYFFCRISAKEFMTAVSSNQEVQSLIKQILQRQSNLYLYMYESLAEIKKTCQGRYTG